MIRNPQSAIRNPQSAIRNPQISRNEMVGTTNKSIAAIPSA
jgi:hypothetical protein